MAKTQNPRAGLLHILGQPQFPWVTLGESMFVWFPLLKLNVEFLTIKPTQKFQLLCDRIIPWIRHAQTPQHLL